jgi:2-iminobutanoate/2-iminopropanoate deaminase
MPDDARRWSPVYLPDLPRPVGPYSPAVRAGDFVYVSGQVPRDPATGALAGADVATQSRAVLANVRRVLQAAGATTSDVVSVIVYLVNVDDWGAFNEVYKEFFTEPYPSRTAVGCDLRGILVEVSCVAYAPR